MNIPQKKYFMDDYSINIKPNTFLKENPNYRRIIPDEINDGINYRNIWDNAQFGNLIKQTFGDQSLFPKETEREKVIRVLKGAFEEYFNMTFDRFVEIYHEILEESPEDLI